MNLNLYIYSGSFAHNGSDSDISVLERLSQFAYLTNKIGEKYRDDNHFLANYEEMNNTVIFSNGTTLCDLLCGSVCDINNEIITAFYLIMTSGYI